MTDPLTRRHAAGLGLGALAALLAGAADAKAHVDDDDDREGLSLRGPDDVAPEVYPWGSIRWLMNAKLDPEAEMTLGVVHIDANRANTVHRHPNSAEYLYVLEGTLEHRVGDRWTALEPGDTLRIPKGTVHGARTGASPCRVLVVYDTGTRQMVPVAE
jgi:quercetin dioxygenase-like cupin family protein